LLKGDSGGPLYVLENEKRAVLVGIVNRGEGCARKNSMGIYARSLITPLYVLPEKKLLCLSPNFHIHVSVSDLCIPTISPHIFLK
jgi:hypothetical protein